MLSRWTCDRSSVKFTRMTHTIAFTPALIWALVASGAVLVGTAVLIPRVITRLPPDYFSTPHPVPLEAYKHRPLLRILLLVGKNLLGGFLLLSGIAMLVLPGQGLLTIAIALVVLDFPGKHRLKRRLFRIRRLRDSINRFRIRHQCEPFQP